jgi:hypothetical protein
MITTVAAWLRARVPEALVVLWTAARVELLLRTSDLPATCRRLGVVLDVGDPTRPRGPMAVLPRWARAPARWTDVLLGHWPFGDTCLRRCLVLGARLQGLAPVLRLGVRETRPGQVAAHAWLEVGGRPLDDDLDGISPLASPGPTP